MTTLPSNSVRRITLLILLLLGGTIFFFSNGLYANIIAVWIAPIILLRFARQSPPLRGFIAIAITTGVASFFMNRGVIPMPFGPYLGFVLILGLFIGMTYLTDRLISPRLPRFWASLVFPAVTVTSLFMSASISPFGTWGNDAYFQIGFWPITQLASVTGIWGICFIVAWFAAGVNDAWQIGWANWCNGRAPWVMGIIIGLVVLNAGGRALLPTPSVDNPIRVATISNPTSVADRFFTDCPERADYKCRQEKSDARHDILFNLSQQAADDGANLIVWYEAAAQYDAQYENVFLTRAQNFARESGVYFVFGAVKVPNDPKALLTNKAVIILPDGKIAGNYLKANPIPGEPIIKGNGDMLTVDTPYGRLGVVICFDADFTRTSHMVVSKDVDILIAPSNDWREIGTIHADIAVFRAIESGASLVRATSNGTSVIADSFGRALAKENSFETNSSTIIAELNSARQHTIYGLIGDGFAIFNSLLLILLVFWRILLVKQSAKMSV